MQKFKCLDHFKQEHRVDIMLLQATHTTFKRTPSSGRISGCFNHHSYLHEIEIYTHDSLSTKATKMVTKLDTNECTNQQ